MRSAMEKSEKGQLPNFPFGGRGAFRETVELPLLRQDPACAARC